MNIERLGQPPPPSRRAGLLPLLGMVQPPRRAPTAKRGDKAPESFCPVPATKSRPCCQKYSPLSLTAASPSSSSSPVAGPKAGDAPGEGYAWGRRHKAVPAPYAEHRDGLPRTGPNPAPHIVLAVILPDAANFNRQPSQGCPRRPGPTSRPERSGMEGWRAGPGAAGGWERSCPGGRRSQRPHKSLFETL